MSKNANALFKVLLDASGHLSVVDSKMDQPLGSRQIGTAGTYDVCINLLESVLVGNQSHSLAPSNELQEAVAHAWRSVLNGRAFGVHDNFFDVGGTSLALHAVAVEVRRVLSLDVSDISVFRYPTIASFANYLRGLQEKSPQHDGPLALASEGTARLRSASSTGSPSDDGV